MSDTPAIQSVEKYGVSINLHDFGQSTFEQYQMESLKAVRHAFFQLEDNGRGVRAEARIRGETVRVALRLKIISGVLLSEVGDMKPYIVTWIADETQKHIASVTTAPNDPN